MNKSAAQNGNVVSGFILKTKAKDDHEYYQTSIWIPVSASTCQRNKRFEGKTVYI